VPSFAVSISILGLVQAALVALPAPRQRPAWIERLSSPWWALVPALSIAVVIGAIEVTPGSADALTYIALVAVPPFAAYALAALIRRGMDWLVAVSVAAALFALAWATPHSLVGETAATALSGFACVTLGWLLVCSVPARWLRLGVYAMAVIDTVYVSSDLLQGPNAVLNAAVPAPGLPQLQYLELHYASMGYGDVFVAGVLGGVLATEGRKQWPVGLLVFALAALWDLLFLLDSINTLPATVPIAAALIIVELRPWLTRRRPGISSVS